MFLTYNSIELQIEHIVSYEKRAVYDPSGVDYLYTHHRLVVRAVWNPAATSNVGQVAAISITELEAALMAPRQLLRLDVPNSGGAVNNVLYSPLRDPVGDQYPCDANNGPKPISFSVVGVVGQKTMICDFAIETWVKNCATNYSILSHRWEMSHQIDQNFLTTRTISGLAILRTDWLNQVGAPQLSPDQYRGWLFHPVPDNYQRTIQIQLSADNTSLRYVITDVEQVYNILPAYRAIIRADVSYSQFTGQIDVNWTGLGTAAALAATGAGALPAAIIAASSISFPKTRFQLNIRLWGRRWCSINTFRAAAANIAAAMRFGTQPVLLGIVLPRWFFQTSFENFSLTSSYWESALVAEVAAGASAFQQTVGIGPASGTFTANSVFNYQDGQTSNPGGPIASQGPTTMYGNREAVQLLIAQMFKEPCALPNRPPQNIAQQTVLSLGNPSQQV